jgi:hypothetical protein
LIDYWRQRLTLRAAPPRGSIDPTDFADLLPQILMLGRLGPGQYQFRLAGDLVTQLHGVSLKEADFPRFWRPMDRTALQLAIESARRRIDPVVIDATAEGAGDPIELEILFCPLSSPDGGLERVLGLYQPKRPPLTIATGQPRAFQLHAARAACANGQTPPPRLKLAAVDGRHIA